jgi:hypothetical protein
MRPPEDAVKVLSCFPGPVTLYPSRAKLFRVFLVSAAFVAASLWILLSNPAGARMPLSNIVIGWTWAGLAFFGSGMLITLGMMLPGASSLTLDRDGFEIIHVYRHFSILWKNASNFETWVIGDRAPKMVVFDSADAKKLAIARLNVALSGHNAGLVDTYGFSAEVLADLMAQWRERAATLR